MGGGTKRGLRLSASPRIAAGYTRAVSKIGIVTLLVFAIPIPCNRLGPTWLAFGQELSTTSECPPDGSLIALLTVQAFNEGRKVEHLEYAKFSRELAAIAASSFQDSDVVEKSIVATTDFARKMTERGHDLTARDLIIHEETWLKSALRDGNSLQPIYRAQLGLHLAVVNEMKRVLCR